jgi:hypothetical protein
MVVSISPFYKLSITVTAASGQDRYTNSQKANYIAHSAIVHYPAIYVRYNYSCSSRRSNTTHLPDSSSRFIDTLYRYIHFIGSNSQLEHLLPMDVGNITRNS